MSLIGGVKTLTEHDKTLLEQQNQKLVSEFKQEKLEKEAGRTWDLFYKRNKVNFYKDRHWTTREFKELENVINFFPCNTLSYNSLS